MTNPHTSDISDSFFPRLREVAAELGAKPLEMLAVMKSESDVRASAWNDNPKSLPPERRWNASGLIQFMPPTLQGLGWKDGHAAFRTLDATAQLDWVLKYYRPYKGHLGSVGGLYVATFLPALVKHAGDPAYVLTAKHGQLPWAYEPNKGFDTNKDLAITVGELEAMVSRACRGARWDELKRRLEGGEAFETFDLHTVRGQQEALSRLGHNPGPIDGKWGPKTKAATIEFQWARGLKPDGIIGPKTRAELEIALKLAA